MLNTPLVFIILILIGGAIIILILIWRQLVGDVCPDKNGYENTFFLFHTFAKGISARFEKATLRTKSRELP